MSTLAGYIYLGKQRLNTRNLHRFHYMVFLEPYNLPTVDAQEVSKHHMQLIALNHQKSFLLIP